MCSDVWLEGGSLSMRVVLSAHFYGKDDEDVINSVKVDTIVPDFEAYDTPDNFRRVFHKFEQAALISRNELGRLLAQVYLEGMLRDRLEARTQEQQGVTFRENSSPYKIEAELGRITVTTYSAELDNHTICDSKCDILPRIGSRETFRSACYEWLQSRLSTENDYRAAVETINHIRWQGEQDTVKLRTLADSVVRGGTELIDHISKMTEDILEKNNFDTTTGRPINPVEIATKPIEDKLIPRSEVARVISEYNAKNAHRGPDFLIDERCAVEAFENPSECVNVSIDDVGVVEQKPTGREKNSKRKESTHYVRNTVAHIQHRDKRYIVTGVGIRHVLTIVVSFLLYNALFWGTPKVFFIDGDDSLRDAIIHIFGWLPIKIVLDWYHLAKKCRYRLSLGLKGKKVVDEVIKKLFPLLWHGKVEAAIEYLEHLDDTKVRASKEIKLLIAYIERNRPYIGCYALRRQLGLRASSNLGEKANDMVVAQRQKHKGMSWSQAGSPALANLRALFVNNEAYSWSVWRELNFRLVPASSYKNRDQKHLHLIDKALQDKLCA